MVFRIKTNIKATQRNLSKMQRQVVPKAARNALNDTAFSVREFVVRTLYPQSFPKRRNRAFPGFYFRVTRRAKIGSLVSMVGPNPRTTHKGFVDQQIKGGRKIARGKWIAVPTRNVTRGQRGPRKDQRPGNLKGAFVADINGRGPGIWTRGKATKAGPGKLTLWYVLEPSVHVEKAFHFYRLGYAKARQQWPKHFDREMRHALSRMRR